MLGDVVCCRAHAAVMELREKEENVETFVPSYMNLLTVKKRLEVLLEKNGKNEKLQVQRR